MYNILIAEDDLFIINSLKNQIQLVSNQIDHIYTAINGKQALDILTDKDVDLLITDIKMPLMNGIELIERLRKENYQCKIIVLSGFDNFKFAQSTIKYDINEYLLKPITKTQLEKSLQKVFSELKEEKKQQAYVTELELKLEKSIHSLTEKFLYECCYGKTNNELYKMLGFDRLSKSKLILFSMEKIQSNCLSDLKEKNNQLTILYFIDLFNQAFKDVFSYSIFTIGNNICVFLSISLKFSNEYLEKVLKQFQNKISVNYQIDFSIGISKTFNNIEDMDIHYKEAEIALNHKLYYGKNSLIFYDNIVNKIKNPIYMDIAKLKDKIYQLLNLEDYNAIGKLLINLKNKLINNSSSISYIKTICIEIITIITIYIYECSLDIEALFSNENNLTERILKSQNINQIFQITENTLNIVETHLKITSQDIVSQRIITIKKLITENISDDITLDKIAETIYLTPNYIGYIFKQSTGISFKDYVKQAKIQKAKELLYDKHLKIYEIAENVGYKSVPYFSKVFKESTGLYPSEYREKNQSHYSIDRS